MAWFLCNFLFFLLLSSATACNRCIHQSKATYFFADPPTSSAGACGYENFAMQISNGYFAAAAPSLFRHGAGCGACYQVRCKNQKFCTRAGTKVVVTDQTFDDRTDLLLSRKAFSAMAVNAKAGKELMNSGIVEVEFKRIPCEYKNKNLQVRVEEWSQKPYDLAIKLLYQGGQTDIQALHISQVGIDDQGKWMSMKRNYGAIWEMDEAAVPEGALQMKMVVTSGNNNGKSIMAHYVLPAQWKNGQIYDTGIQIKDIAAENCDPDLKCGDQEWH